MGAHYAIYQQPLLTGVCCEAGWSAILAIAWLLVFYSSQMLAFFVMSVISK